MTRLARIVIPGWVHHVTQRGNHRQTVFFGDNDRLVYIALLAKCLSLHDILLVGYCFMGNHVHLAMIPKSESTFGKGIGQMHHDYALWQNVQRNQNGHLWQNRFFSCPVEEDRVWDMLAYIELNPVRAGLVANAWDWKWSSAQAHIGDNDPSNLLDMNYLRKTFTAEEWKQYLMKVAAEREMATQVRTATATGCILASEETVRRLEQKMGRALLPQKRGRKPQNR
jgi:putative transposase